MTLLRRPGENRRLTLAGLRAPGRAFAVLGTVVACVLAGGCIYVDSPDPCADGFTPYSAPTLIGGLYATCFPRCSACADAEIDAVLYLDTTDLPTDNADVWKLVLSSRPTGPGGAGLDRLEYSFLPDSLPVTIDPGLEDQAGWKVRVAGASLQYCEVCLTNCGLAPFLLLRGDRESVTFIHDPADTMQIYINRHPRALP
jgi:hypothetical protein